ncbi:hypothetical protein C0Q70_19799 [Pomacea canaliculata]|uniref:G-protein coupled receptors family 1 profile domain-containing protein n=1 Tax=Pomacea canaliculata TaxID=400727 RepID=A0A2T7NDU1_POMCA|nr:hypothetical protein C0Q70_19799 [Pomacea canaliculata]
MTQKRVCTHPTVVDAVATAAMNSTNDTVAGPTSIFDRYPSTTELVEKFVPTAPLVERWILPLWYIIGLTGNPVSAIVWFGRRMRRNNSSAIYLGSLAVSDVIFLLLHLLYSLNTVWGYQYLSVVLVLGFTVERYTAVCHPFLKEKWCTVRRACFIVVVFVVLSVALSAAQIYIWTYNEEQKSCNHRPVATEGDESSFFNIWTWSVDMVVFAALPLIVLVFNALVLREIIKLSNNGVITRQQAAPAAPTTRPPH